MMIDLEDIRQRIETGPDDALRDLAHKLLAEIDRRIAEDKATDRDHFVSSLKRRRYTTDEIRKILVAYERGDKFEYEETKCRTCKGEGRSWGMTGCMGGGRSEECTACFGSGKDRYSIKVPA